MNTIQFTADNHLCISCGICKAICPQKCIELSEKKGLYIPTINSTCAGCGVCFDVCPGKGKLLTVSEQFSEQLKEEELLGTYKFIYNAWSKN